MTVRLRLICNVCSMFFNILVNSIWMTARLILIYYVCSMFFSILIDFVWMIVRWINLLERHNYVCCSLAFYLILVDFVFLFVDYIQYGWRLMYRSKRKHNCICMAFNLFV
jgi:hypothetical protein